MIILGLGSNQGDKKTYLEKSIAALSNILTSLRCSSFYESDALLPQDAPENWNIPFLNRAISGETLLSPQDLLKEIKTIEKKLGRIDRGRWGPREIDIDILAYHDDVIQEPDLIIPHVGLLERDFALIPFAEIAPDWVYPVEGPDFGKTANYLSCQRRLASRWQLRKQN
jgi:2-amino-4-hydroxy-6-hydroxymethyldihydropteridine diphosphokinase